MPETILRKADGTSGGNVSLSEKLFSAKINTGLMHQAVVNEATNSRQDTRDTKTRAEVAGGGRKPYRQKGTGRARQGTISAPHYRHGGIVFGPHQRDLSAKLPKKARRAALASALIHQSGGRCDHRSGQPEMDTHSTKTAAALLETLGVTGKALIVLPDVNLTIYKSFRNIPGVQVPGRPGILRSRRAGCRADCHDAGRAGEIGCGLRRRGFGSRKPNRGGDAPPARSPSAPCRSRAGSAPAAIQLSAPNRAPRTALNANRVGTTSRRRASASAAEPMWGTRRRRRG